MRGNHDYGISQFDGIFTAWGDNLSAAVDAGDQQIIFKGKLFQRYANERRIFSNAELQRLRLVLHDLVQGLDIASPWNSAWRGHNG